MINVAHISKSYGKLNALNDVSFQLKRGDIVGFLGTNGAGKSTTMRIIAGTLCADKGNVSIFGKDIEENSIEAKKLIGYLPEDNPLYDYMYVTEFLEYITTVYSVKNEKEAISETIEKVGLQKEFRKKIGTLSKGNRQRVGLAQTLIHDPEFLILDEPTSGLDPNQQADIHQLLSDLGQSKIILFSSHILHEVTSVCNRNIIINNGQIVFDDKITEGDSIEDIFYNLTK